MMGDDQEAGATVQGLTEETEAPPERSGAAALIPLDSGGLMLRSLEDLMRFARLLVKDGAVPRGMTVGAVAIAVQAGLERGLGISGGLNFGTVINGRFAWNGQGAYALIQNSKVCRPGTLKTFLEGEGDERKGVAVAHRVGYEKAERREFTIQQAKQARLWGKAGPWTDYPDRQLVWRALGFLARDVFADVLGGFPLAEEAQDFEEPAIVRAPEARLELPAPKTPDPLFDAIEKAAPEDLTKSESANAQAVNCEHGNLVEGFCSECSNDLDAQTVHMEKKRRKCP